MAEDFAASFADRIMFELFGIIPLAQIRETLSSIKFLSENLYERIDLMTGKSEGFFLGDIAIDYEIINSRRKGNNFLLEFDKVWIHGLLHLLGFDHKRNKDYFKMNRLEKRFLNLVC